MHGCVYLCMCEIFWFQRHSFQGEQNGVGFLLYCEALVPNLFIVRVLASTHFIQLGSLWNISIILLFHEKHVKRGRPPAVSPRALGTATPGSTGGHCIVFQGAVLTCTEAALVPNHKRVFFLLFFFCRLVHGVPFALTISFRCLLK